MEGKQMKKKQLIKWIEEKRADMAFKYYEMG